MVYVFKFLYQLNSRHTTYNLLDIQKGSKMVFTYFKSILFLISHHTSEVVDIHHAMGMQDKHKPLLITERLEYAHEFGNGSCQDILIFAMFLYRLLAF